MWDFSDPVVFLAVFTVAFGVGMLIFLYFWVKKNMSIDSSDQISPSRVTDNFYNCLKQYTHDRDRMDTERIDHRGVG